MNSITKDLRKKTNEELTEIVSKLKLQLLEIRFSASSGETEKQANASEIRKTIARALTIINEREFIKKMDNKKILNDKVVEENGKK
ncbi:MAG: 50S ribosomal protein L29 [Ureaplasma sp.]|nr:50S ribosomal protein L29 [Ureaplasma sp.]